jgi:hypothetical protein
VSLISLERRQPSPTPWQRPPRPLWPAATPTATRPRRPSWRRQRPRQRDPAAVLPSSQSASTFAVGTANAVHGSVHAPIGTAVTASVAATAASHVATAAAAAAAVATAACDSLAALELPQRCPRWRPQIAAAVPTMAPDGSTEISMRGLPISAPISPPQGKPRVVAPAAATPLAAVVAVKGVGHLPLRDDLSAPAAAASAALDASSAALGSGSRAAAAPQRAAAAPIDPVRQRVRQRGTR